MTAGEGHAASRVSAELLRSVRRQWGWPIAVYLFLAGMGAGAFVVGVFARSLGLGAQAAAVVMVGGVQIDVAGLGLLWGPIVVAVGAPFLIVDLGRKARFFRAGLNLRASWMARGFYILSAFIVVGGLACGLAVLAPEWPGAHAGLWRALLAVGVLLALATALYTGVLLKSLKFVPVWRSNLLPLLFLVSALSTGSMGIILASLAVGSSVGDGEWARELAHSVARVEQGLILFEAGVLALYLLRVRKEGSSGEASVEMLVRGRLRLLFWGGIVALGLVFPTLLEFLYEGLPDYQEVLALAGMLLLIGGFFLRLGLLAAASKEELPLQRLLEVRAHARKLRVDL